VEPVSPFGGERQLGPVPCHKTRQWLMPPPRLMRIGIRGTTPHGLRRPKEGSAMNGTTIQKISEDHGVHPKV
jgi:hypothetical protein